MKGFFSIFKDSAKELKNVRNLAVVGMMIALYVILAMFARINITENLRISFGFLALAVVGMLYGPVAGFAAGAIGDVLGYFLGNSVGAFFPGYTVTYAVEGLIFGLMLYRSYEWKYSIRFARKSDGKIFDITKIIRYIFARVVVIIVCYLFINTINRYIVTGTAALSWPAMTSRIIKNTIQIPIDVIMMSFLLPSVMAAYKRVFKKKAA